VGEKIVKIGQQKRKYIAKKYVTQFLGHREHSVHIMRPLEQTHRALQSIYDKI